MIDYDMSTYTPKDLAAEFAPEDLKGSHREIAEVIGVEAAFELFDALGGEMIQFPCAASLFRPLHKKSNTTGAPKNRYTLDELLKCITLEDLSGRFKDVAKAVGIEAAVRLADSFRGIVVYIPIGEAVRLRLRRKLIYRDFYDNGMTVKEIGRKYHVPRPNVHKIINLRQNEL